METIRSALCRHAPALALLLVFAVAAVAGRSDDPPRPVKVSIAAHAAGPDVGGGRAIAVEVLLAIKHGYHLFAPSPANAEFETVSVTLTASAGRLDAPAIPAGVSKNLAAIGATADLLEGDVPVRTTLHLPEPFRGKVHVKAQVHYQACSELMCYLPIDDIVESDLDAQGSPTGPAPGPSPGPSSGSPVGPSAESPAGPSGGSPAESPARAPPAPRGDAGPDGSTKASPGPSSGLRPSTGAGAPGEMSTGMPAPLDTAPQTAAASEAPAGGAGEGTVAEWFRTRGTLAALLLIYLGGLSLNLTPCVYPMIPVTISFFGAQASGRAGRSLALALAYVLGMSVTYSALGVIAALSGRALGTVVGSPPFLAFTALVFVALALSFLGLYEIRAPGFIADRASAREGLLGAGAMGLLVGFVAAPCLAPAILGLMLYVGQVGSVAWGFLLFFVLSLGLGTPFLVLGTASGLISALPGSGAWMESVKHFFAAVLLACAIYFVSPAMPDAVTRILAGVLLLAVGLSAGALEGGQAGAGGEAPPAGELAHWGRVGQRAVAVAALVAGAAVVWTAVVPSPPDGARGAGNAGVMGAAAIDWRADEGAIDAARQAGRPVMIDFTDTRRCVACVELEEKTYPDPKVVAESRRFVAIKIDAWTHPRAAALARAYQVLGFPTILFLDGSGRSVPDATVVGFVPPDRFLAAMRKVR